MADHGSSRSEALARIAAALERLAPARAARPDFGAARLFRHDPASGGFVPAPDFALALDLLVGVERQKLRFTENLGRFAAGLPANHVLLWGVRGTGKSSLAKAAFMAVAEPARRPEAGGDRPRRRRPTCRCCSTSCAAGPSVSWCSATTCRSRKARRPPRR